MFVISDLQTWKFLFSWEIYTCYLKNIKMSSSLIPPLCNGPPPRVPMSEELWNKFHQKVTIQKISLKFWEWTSSGFFFNILSRVFKNEYELTRFQSLFLLHTTGIVYLGEDKVSLRSSGWLQTPWHVPVSASWELQGLLSHNTYVRTCSSFARIAWPSSFQLIWDSPGGRNVLIHKFHWTNKTVMPGPWMAAGRVRR